MQATLICAGDISMDMDVLSETLVFLKGIFAHVFFCPVRIASASRSPPAMLTRWSIAQGNNELRLSKHERKTFASSIDKFHAVLKLCSDLGAPL